MGPLGPYLTPKVLVKKSFKGRVLSQKWDCLPSVRYTNIHTEQRYCLYSIFVQIWVLGDNSTKLAHCLAESQGLFTLTKPDKLVIVF